METPKNSGGNPFPESQVQLKVSQIICEDLSEQLNRSFVRTPTLLSIYSVKGLPSFQRMRCRLPPPPIDFHILRYLDPNMFNPLAHES